MRKIFSLIAAVLFAGSMMATTVTKTVAELAVEKSFTNSAVCTPFDLDEVISVSTSASDANTGKYYSNGEQIRLYQTGAASITLTAAEGYKISSVTLTYASQNTGILVEAESGVAVDFENVQSATFTVGNSGTATNGQARITAFSVTYDADGAVPPTPADTYTVAGSPASVFGSNWDEADATNDMVLANGIYKWEKEVQLSVGTIEFKVVKNHEWEEGSYPGSNYEIAIAEEGTYTITITFDPTTTTVAAEVVLHEPLADPTNCAEAAAAALSVSANNELYNNGAVYTIEGYVTSIKTAYNDQYHNVSFWMADAVDGGEVLQAYRAACASEEDVPAVGAKVQVTGTLTKYGTTPEFSAGCTFVITEAPAPAEEYYLTGSFRNWATTAESDFHFVANPAAAGEYMLKGIALAANAEIKVIGILGENVNWYPAVGDNYTVEAEGEYDIYFRPDGQGGQDWHQGYFYVAAVEPIAAPTNCAEAAAAALSVSANNELYNNGAVYSIRGYVTGIKTAYNDQYHNVSFWIADAVDGGEVLQAYRAACASEDDVPAVGAIVEVTGSLTKYNTTPEFAAGCTFVILDDIHTAIDNTNIDAKVIKTIENGQLIIIKNGVRYNAQGAVVR